MKHGFRGKQCALIRILWAFAASEIPRAVVLEPPGDRYSISLQQPRTAMKSIDKDQRQYLLFSKAESLLTQHHSFFLLTLTTDNQGTAIDLEYNR